MFLFVGLVSMNYVCNLSQVRSVRNRDLGQDWILAGPKFSPGMSIDSIRIVHRAPYRTGFRSTSHTLNLPPPLTCASSRVWNSEMACSRGTMIWGASGPRRGSSPFSGSRRSLYLSFSVTVVSSSHVLWKTSWIWGRMWMMLSYSLPCDRPCLNFLIPNASIFHYFKSLAFSFSCSISLRTIPVGNKYSQYPRYCMLQDSAHHSRCT